MLLERSDRSGPGSSGRAPRDCLIAARRDPHAMTDKTSNYSENLINSATSLTRRITRSDT